MTWHADAELLERYAGHTLPDAAAWSVETHLSACARCRGRLDEVSAAIGDATGVDDARLAAVWAEVREGVRVRERPAIERLLVRAGVADHDARLLAATPSLTASWLLGVVLVLATGVAAAWVTRPASAQALFVFLVLAPLVPVAGVGVAFGPRIDPTYELGIAAPMSATRLLLLRSVAVLVSSLVLAAIAALALPAGGWTAVAWILPSLAMTTAVLAGASRWHPLACASAVGVVWIIAVMTVESQLTGSFVAFGTAGQVAMAALLAASLTVFAATHERLDPAAPQ